MAATSAKHKHKWGHAFANKREKKHECSTSQNKIEENSYVVFEFIWVCQNSCLVPLRSSSSILGVFLAYWDSAVLPSTSRNGLRPRPECNPHLLRDSSADGVLSKVYFVKSSVHMVLAKIFSHFNLQCFYDSTRPQPILPIESRGPALPHPF